MSSAPLARVAADAASPPHRPARRAALAAAAVATVLAVSLLAQLVEPPARVDRLSFVNATAYDLDVDTTGAERDGWLGLGTASRRSTTVVEDVLDQGDVWVFRFAAQGEEGGELRVTRAELARSGWRVVVPESVGQALQDKGAPPTP